jgi:hypothetical protein
MQVELPAKEFEFSGHSKQASAPAAVLYFPAIHVEHGPPPGPVAPASHVQLVKAELPAGASELVGQSKHVESAIAPTAVEYLPCPQSLQASGPAAVLYFPAIHVEHGPPPGPVAPALHVQLVKAELPAGASDCVVQSKPVESAVAPTAAEYLPVEQGVQPACMPV